jgi:hypothetical protein
VTGVQTCALPIFGGAGGIGYQNSITGISTYYAGGGGGNIQYSNAPGGIGGLGGGGDGGAAHDVLNSIVGAGMDGIDGLGGGGGGSQYYSDNNFAPRRGYGGSGVVIIKWV